MKLSKLRILFQTAHFVLLFVLSVLMPAFAQEVHNDDVVNLNAKQHFSWIGDLYSDGKNKFLCVKTDAGKYALWNLDEDTLSSETKHTCHPTSTLHLAKPNVDGGTKVSVSTSSSVPCGRMFDFFYTITFPNEQERSFYIVGKLETPQQTDEYWCNGARDSGTKFSQSFDDVFAKFTTLKDGSLLFYSNSYAETGMCSACWNTISQPVLLRIKTVPETTWSSNDDVFLIPGSLLTPALNEADINNASRYADVMQAIGKKQASSTAP